MTEGAETLRVFVRPIGGTPAELAALLTIDNYVPPAQFNITFDFNGDAPQSEINASAQAAARWTAVLVGELPDVNRPTYGIVSDILITVQMGTPMMRVTHWPMRSRSHSEPIQLGFLTLLKSLSILPTLIGLIWLRS